MNKEKHVFDFELKEPREAINEAWGLSGHLGHDLREDDR